MFTSMFARRWTLHRLHKWLGLVAAIWLIVLGVTGFVLDHRETWQWLWQSGVSESWINDAVSKKSETGQIKLYQINPSNSKQHVSGGLTGLWWSEQSGQYWENTHFLQTAKSPMIYATQFSQTNTLWIATDNGLWSSADAGKTATKRILSNKWISSFAINNHTNTITGIISRSEIFNYNIAENKVNTLHIKSIQAENLPASISLSRFTRDIHYGRGVFNIDLSLLWNDISAIAMVVLSLTGFFFFFLPKKWRRDKEKKIKINHKTKKQSIRWLFRLHAPTFGLIAAVPIIYLSLTGILLDHAKALRGWMKSTEVTQTWQTPVYNFKTWKGEIYGVVNYSDNPTKISLATRLGLFTSEDLGQNWQRENLSGSRASFVWTLRRLGDAIFIGGMGSANRVKISGQTSEQQWQVVKHSGHMPSDITRLKDNWIWKSRHGLISGNINKGFSHQNRDFPEKNYVPWFFVIDGLHSGVLIHSQWKWVNDLVALIAIFLAISGFLRWRHKKWI